MKARDLQELNDFIPYFNSFYGPNGLYPIREVTSKEILKALCTLFTIKPDHEFSGDSYDRELIRDIIFGTKEHINQEQ
jgi:hypothetical protein